MTWKRLLILCFLAGFGIFFGIDLAGKGIVQIHGPLEGGASSPSASAVSPTPPPEAPSAAVAVVSPVMAARDSLINRLANKTGEALQWIAYTGIKAVISLFDGIFK